VSSRPIGPGAPSLDGMATYVAVFALVLAYVAFVAAYCALRTLARLRRDTRLLARGTRGPEGKQSLIEVITRHAELTATVADQIEVLRAHVDSTQEAMRGEVATARQEALAAITDRVESESGALRHVALVRYDAFTEMSGRMSFSLAVLDDLGDGITITAMTGRTDTRVYAKSVADGAGEHELSPEERQAVASALGATKRRIRKAS
jgi:hypothetical protein